MFPSPPQNFLSTEKWRYLPLRRDTLLNVVHMTSFRSRINRKLSAVRVSGDSVHWSYTITSEYSSMSRWQVWLRRSPTWTWNQRSRLLYQLRMKIHFQYELRIHSHSKITQNKWNVLLLIVHRDCELKTTVKWTPCPLPLTTLWIKESEPPQKKRRIELTRITDSSGNYNCLYCLLDSLHLSECWLSTFLSVHCLAIPHWSMSYPTFHW